MLILELLNYVMQQLGLNLNRGSLLIFGCGAKLASKTWSNKTRMDKEFYQNTV